MIISNKVKCKWCGIKEGEFNDGKGELRKFWKAFVLPIDADGKVDVEQESFKVYKDAVNELYNLKKDDIVELEVGIWVDNKVRNELKIYDVLSSAVDYSDLLE